MSDITLCDCEEHWMEIKNKNGSKYLLSSKGRLYSYKSGRFIGKKSIYGYIIIRWDFSNCMHRLVYRYFNKINIEEVNENNQIDHINTIRNHNCLCNLRCCSITENNNNPLTKKKYSIWQIGKSFTQETKKKISESKKKIKIKCYFCNSKEMYISNFGKYHGNGKCLFK